MLTVNKRIMALDVGEARIGIALSDPLCMFAQPWRTIERAGGRELKEIAELCAEQGVGKIIVGIPYELSGKLGLQAQKVISFVKCFNRALGHLEQTREIELTYWDERMTTKQAKRVTAGSGLRNKDCRSALDRVSAAIILESFLVSIHGNNSCGLRKSDI